MSEEVNATPEAPAQEPATAEAPTVEETDWKAEARKWEQRAKENKGAADELTSIREAQKSEAEKAADALRKAQDDAAAARAESLRLRIAAKYGISDEDADLFLTGTDEDNLTRQAKRLADRAADESKPRTPKPDPNQGRTGTGSASTAEQFAGAVSGLFT